MPAYQHYDEEVYKSYKIRIQHDFGVGSLERFHRFLLNIAYDGVA